MTERPMGPLPLDVPVPGASFSDLLEIVGASPNFSVPEGATTPSAPEGTTVLALHYPDGVVIAGDRRATEGNLVAHRRIRKVFKADHYSAIAIAGTAGLAIDMVKLFQVELEHYEKIEGIRLSLEGKASFLARLVRGQLPLAFQGLVVVPLFAGYDERLEIGRVYSFDIVGGRYEEIDFGSTGSGSRLARSYLRTAYEDDLTGDDAAQLAVQALVSASQEDTATGGPDLRRGIFPNVVRIDSDGVEELSDDVIAPIAESALETIR
ncbi:MAG: proteasome subunit beta [Actinobacteria bacterium]|nr:proteasome subunit beta [Actinomycetota bacterium]MCZ6630388.1 proteasome subunit beta [Actinomycetota bacterium]MCZ6737139.1 proteasome subunit beta [Actinomycetota bacterium]